MVWTGDSQFHGNFPKDKHYLSTNPANGKTCMIAYGSVKSNDSQLESNGDFLVTGDILDIVQ